MTYVLENGVSITNIEHEGTLIINYSHTKAHIENVQWKIIGCHGNDVYFKFNAEVSLFFQKATFTNSSFSIETLQASSSQTPHMLNFPYYAIRKFSKDCSVGFTIRSLTSGDSFHADFAGITNSLTDFVGLTNSQCFVYREYILLVNLGQIVRIGNGEDKVVVAIPQGPLPPTPFPEFSRNTFVREDVLLVRPKFSKMFIFGKSLYATDEYSAALFVLDIPTMTFKKLHFLSASSSIRCITSAGVMIIDTFSRDKTFKTTMEYHLVSSEVTESGGSRESSAERKSPKTIQQPLESGENAELKRKNEELEKRVEDLERKYRQLLMITARASNSSTKS